MKSFEIISVSAEKIQWKPLAGKGTLRSWPRKDIEAMYEVRVKQGSLSPSDIRGHWPNDQNSSYVPVIVNAVYSGKTLIKQW